MADRGPGARDASAGPAPPDRPVPFHLVGFLRDHEVEQAQDRLFKLTAAAFGHTYTILRNEFPQLPSDVGRLATCLRKLQAPGYRDQDLCLVADVAGLCVLAPLDTMRRKVQAALKSGTQVLLACDTAPSPAPLCSWWQSRTRGPKPTGPVVGTVAGLRDMWSWVLQQPELGPPEAGYARYRAQFPRRVRLDAAHALMGEVDGVAAHYDFAATAVRHLRTGHEPLMLLVRDAQPSTAWLSPATGFLRRIGIPPEALLRPDSALTDAERVARMQMPEPPVLDPSAAPHALQDVSLTPDPGRSYAPSPADWRDEVLYSVILDRFAREAPYMEWGDPASGYTRHGGNLRGLRQRLPYIKELGATAVLLSPVGLSLEYHSYSPVHLLAVDPFLGTKTELQALLLSFGFVDPLSFSHEGRAYVLHPPPPGPPSPPPPPTCEDSKCSEGNRKFKNCSKTRKRLTSPPPPPCGPPVSRGHTEAKAGVCHQPGHLRGLQHGDKKWEKRGTSGRK